MIIVDDVRQTDRRRKPAMLLLPKCLYEAHYKSITIHYKRHTERMRLIIFSLSYTFLIWGIFSSLTPTYASAEINVWPKPTSLSWPHPQAALLSPGFYISSPNHPYLSPAVNRYLLQILTEHYQPVVEPSVNLSASAPPLQTLAIIVADLSAPLHHGVNESYSLFIPSDGDTANLTAETVWGAMRGLETFSQLVWGNPSRVPVGLYLWDSPLFPHRGIMLDTSRNYYPVKDLLRTIGAMSANKLNVFHWHITDSHSFPLVLPSMPELAAKGSYGPTMQYSPADVAAIVRFGLEHGVRVLPEIDSPGQYIQSF